MSLTNIIWTTFVSTFGMVFFVSTLCKCASKWKSHLDRETRTDFLKQQTLAAYTCFPKTI